MPWMMVGMHISCGLEPDSIYGVQVEFPKKKKKVGGTVKTCRRVGGFASGFMYLGTQPNLEVRGNGLPNDNTQTMTIIQLYAPIRCRTGGLPRAINSMIGLLGHWHCFL